MRFPLRKSVRRTWSLSPDSAPSLTRYDTSAEMAVRLLEFSRSLGRYVSIQHVLAKNCPLEPLDNFDPLDNEGVCHYRPGVNNPLRNTEPDLLRSFQKSKTRNLIISGIRTSGLIRSLVQDARSEGINVIVVHDACADPEDERANFLLSSGFVEMGAEVSSVDDVVWRGSEWVFEIGGFFKISENVWIS